MISTLGNVLVNLSYVLVLVFLILFIKMFGYLFDEKKVMIVFIIISPLFVFLFKTNIRDTLILALITWWFFMMGLYNYFNDIKKIPLIYAFTVFYSEFYELPIYFSRYLREVKIINSSPIFILLRLSTLFYILYALKIYNYNYRNYLEHLLKMFCLSIPLCSYLLIAQFQGYDLLMILKIFNFIGLIYYLNKNKGEKQCY